MSRSRNHVRFGSPADNCMHPDNWKGIDTLIDEDLAANRSRFDDSVLRDSRPSTYRKPSRIRIGRRFARELWALVFLVAVLFLAGLFKQLKG
jgi:hypothetical protein